MTSHTEHDPDEPDAPEQPRRRGPDPLSQATRRKLLGTLLRAAENGDAVAAATLIELGLSAERDAQIAAMLAQLKADGRADGAGGA